MRLDHTNYRPENIFLIFAIVFGLGLVFITPPFQVSDEIVHFYMAYEFSDFNPKDKYIPQSLVTTSSAFENIPFHRENKTSIEHILNFIDLPLDSDNKIYFQLVLYSPVPYIPQIVAISIGKVFGVSPLILMYLGRIANLVAWVFLVYMTIRISPVAKWLFFLFALTPMSIFQASSLSPDAITNGMSFLVISMVLYYSLDHKKQRVNRTDVLFIFLSSSIISLSKQAYLFIPFLFFLIPMKKFNSRKEYISILILLLLSVVSLNILWYININTQMIEERAPEGASISKQFHYIIDNPLSYMSVLINTIYTLWQWYVKAFIGILGWGDTPLPDYIYKSYIPVLLLVSIFDKRSDIAIKWKMKCAFWIVFCSIFIVILTSMYLTWTKVGCELISGVQGRYFIPIAPLLFMLLYNNQKILNDGKKKLPPFIIGYSFVILLISTYYVIQRYYV